MTAEKAILAVDLGTSGMKVALITVAQLIRRAEPSSTTATCGVAGSITPSRSSRVVSRATTAMESSSGTAPSSGVWRENCSPRPPNASTSSKTCMT